MKTIACFLLFLFVSASLAQITFTREWVKGKRATTANSIMPKDGHTVCRSLVSAVEYLIELEKVRKAECAECCVHGAPPALPVLPDIQRSPADFMTFLRDIPQVDPEQIERVVSNGDRRIH